ncbi:MAG: hypothetical protein ACLQVJ_00025 [Syntrophobacteraceae bacterium]
MNTEFVAHRTWDAYARRLERKNLKEHGKSFAATSISRHANTFIVEIRDDRKGMIVLSGWRQAMKEASRRLPSGGGN